MQTNHLNERDISASGFEYSKNLIHMGREVICFCDKYARINNDKGMLGILKLHPFIRLNVLSQMISFR